MKAYIFLMGVFHTGAILLGGLSTLSITIINLPWTYTNFHWIGEPYRSISYRDLNLQSSDTELKLYLVSWRKEAPIIRFCTLLVDITIFPKIFSCNSNSTKKIFYTWNVTVLRVKHLTVNHTEHPYWKRICLYSSEKF